MRVMQGSRRSTHTIWAAVLPLLAASGALHSARAERNVRPSPAPAPAVELRFKAFPQRPLTMAPLAPDEVRFTGPLQKRLMEPAVRYLVEGPDPAEKDRPAWTRAATLLALYSGSGLLRQKLERVAHAAGQRAVSALVLRSLYLNDEAGLTAAKALGAAADDLEGLSLLHLATGEEAFLKQAQEAFAREAGADGWITRVLTRRPLSNPAALLPRCLDLLAYSRISDDARTVDAPRLVWRQLCEAPPRTGPAARHWLRLSLALLTLTSEERYADAAIKAFHGAAASVKPSLEMAEMASLAPPLTAARCYYGGEGLAFLMWTDCELRFAVGEREQRVTERIKGHSAQIEVAPAKQPGTAGETGGAALGFRFRSPYPGTGATISLSGASPVSLDVPGGDWGILAAGSGAIPGEVTFDPRADDPKAPVRSPDLRAALRSTRAIPVAALDGHLEGPVWRDGGGLLFCSDGEGHVMRLVDEHVRTRTERLLPLGSSGLLHRRDGHTIATDNREHRILDLAPDGKVHVLADQCAGKPLRLTNDVTMDASGALYWTDPADCDNGKAGGWVLRRSPAGVVDRIATGLRYPNGIEADPTGKWLYVVQSSAHNVLRYALPEAGKPLGKPTVFCTLLAGGVGDGMTVDAQGNVYVASYSGRRVEVFNPSGARFGFIAAPRYAVTNLCFGGPNFDELYLTGDGTGGNPGAVLRVQLGVRGFRGWAGAPLKPLRTLDLKTEPLPIP